MVKGSGTFGIFGNRGAYRMPHTDTFATRAEAVEHARRIWGLDNRYVVVLELATELKPNPPIYVHTGFEAGAL